VPDIQYEKGIIRNIEYDSVVTDAESVLSDSGIRQLDCVQLHWQLPPAAPGAAAKGQFHFRLEGTDHFPGVDLLTRPLDAAEIPFGAQCFLVFEQIFGLAPERQRNQHYRLPDFDLPGPCQNRELNHGSPIVADHGEPWPALGTLNLWQAP
jgi:hypothetical protein